MKIRKHRDARFCTGLWQTAVGAGPGVICVAVLNPLAYQTFICVHDLPLNAFCSHQLHLSPSYELLIMTPPYTPTDNVIHGGADATNILSSMCFRVRVANSE